MNALFFTPGPGELYPGVTNWIGEALDLQIPSISHRSSAFEEIYCTVEAQLRSLMSIPNSHRIYFLGSATEVMERVLQSTVRERSVHFVNGAFSKRFHQIAKELGKNPISVDAPEGEGFELDSFNFDHQVEAFCLTQNETSTGVMLPADHIGQFATRWQNQLIIVDLVSSAPYPQIDFAQVDCGFFSVQKCFGLPAGLGVAIVGERCLEKARQLKQQGFSLGSYHNFLELESFSQKHQTPETPNVMGIYLLGRVCEALLTRGIDSVRAEMDQKANMLYSFATSHAGIEIFVKDHNFRSPTVIVLGVNDSDKLRSELSKAGIKVGAGYGKLKEKQVRIANFPAHTTEHVARLIECLDNLVG
ncbi:MAG: alanine--glyoxylate aminotransferase family protein [Bdellovibrionales bacterium]|nr:alanine--glyoxylate aminotransferase family protein [Bdellovibrionales bacterium]